jgi:hypothetical protein
VLANAAHVKNVPGRKTDVNDEMWLAELLAHGLIRASFVPDAQTQEMRNLLMRDTAWSSPKCYPPRSLATTRQNIPRADSFWAAAARPCSSATGGTRFSATEVASSVLLAVLDGAVHMVGQSEPQMHLILSA